MTVLVGSDTRHWDWATVARPDHCQGNSGSGLRSHQRSVPSYPAFLDLEDGRQRIGLFIDHYNFQRPHQEIDGLAPADRFLGAAAEVKRTLEARVQANTFELARDGLPKTACLRHESTSVEFGPKSPICVQSEERRLLWFALFRIGASPPKQPVSGRTQDDCVEISGVCADS
jgi:hypothetical protein